MSDYNREISPCQISDGASKEITSELTSEGTAGVNDRKWGRKSTEKALGVGCRKDIMPI